MPSSTLQPVRLETEIEGGTEDCDLQLPRLRIADCYSLYITCSNATAWYAQLRQRNCFSALQQPEVRYTCTPRQRNAYVLQHLRR